MVAIAHAAGLQTRRGNTCRRRQARQGPEIERPSLQLLRQQGAVGIIEIDHRSLQAGPVEQGPLGLPVGFHGAVVVQMVLREVGEHRHADRRAVEPVLGNADGGSLHHAGPQSLVDEMVQLALQQHGVGSGHAGIAQLGLPTHEAAHAQGAHEATAPGTMREGLGQPPGAGGLAIGAGHGHHVEPTRGRVVERGSDRARGGLEPGIGCHTPCCDICRCRAGEVKGIHAIGLDQAGRRSVLQRGQHVHARIMGGAGPGHEQVARFQPAAVRLQTAAVRAQPGGGFGRGAQKGQHRGAHRDSSGSSVMTPGRTDMSGCTPRMRRVCCTTSLNTGAAVRPP